MTTQDARKAAAMAIYAADLARAYPTADAVAIGDKLWTVFPEITWAARMDVAQIAINATRKAA